MSSRAGRFAATDTTAAESLFEEVFTTESSWCNLVFEPMEDEDGQGPIDSPLFGFLAARGPANPLATIMAPSEGRKSRPAQVGIQHQAGTKAATQLREESLLLPAGARVAQDHPRRGLVVEWPADAGIATVVAWLFPAMRVLGRAPTTEHVLYEWHEGKR